MAKRKQNQLLDDHQEWVEHVDNPGYWVDRISLANKSGWRWWVATPSASMGSVVEDHWRSDQVRCPLLADENVP